MSTSPTPDARGRDAATIPDRTYHVDPARSTLQFRAKAFGLMWVRGHMPVASGTIRVAWGRLEGSGEIGAAELDTGLAARTAFFGYFADGCDFRMGNAQTVHGRENIQNWVASYLGSVVGMQHVILEEWGAGDVAAVRVEVTYTMQNGAQFTLPAVTRTRVRDGKITEYLIFMDPSPVAAAS